MAFDFRKSLKNRQNSRPVREYLWRVEMPVLTEFPVAGVNPPVSFRRAVEIKEAESNISNFNISDRVLEMATPYFNIETDKVIDGASFWYRLNHNDIGGISMVIEEQEDGKTWDYLSSWRDLAVNNNGTYNPPVFYKRDIRVYRLNTMKLDFQEFVYSGYFLNEVSSIQNGYTGGDLLKYNVQFTGDSMQSNTLAPDIIKQEFDDWADRHGNIEIEYNPQDFEGVPSTVVADLIGRLGNRIRGF